MHGGKCARDGNRGVAGNEKTTRTCATGFRFFFGVELASTSLNRVLEGCKHRGVPSAWIACGRSITIIGETPVVQLRLLTDVTKFE